MTAMDLGAAAIISVTSSGQYGADDFPLPAQCPIVALTRRHGPAPAVHLLGRDAEAIKRLGSTDELFEEGVRRALETVSSNTATPLC
jgi:hypothetical protein